MKRSKTQAERLLELDRRLRNKEYPNCTSFAVEWEVSTKTVQRDIEFLKDRMGAPLEYDALQRGFYYTEPTFMLPAVQMNEGELAALLMSSRVLEQFKGTPLAEKLTAIFEKLSALLPDTITVRPEELFTKFSFTAPPAMPVSSTVWNTVVQGLENQQMLEIRYRNWSGEKTSRVAPVHLANLQGDWYLFVQYAGFDNFRQLALARIQQVKLLKDKAVIAGTFDPKKELANTFSKFAGENEVFRVTVQFDAEIADEVLERQWHPEQTVKNLKNGGVEISFAAKGDLEVKRWVLAFGRYANVKSPQWLKEQIDEEIRAMLSRQTASKV
jgi:predicted DNA-binding transcriptional regulator YafY